MDIASSVRNGFDSPYSGLIVRDFPDDQPIATSRRWKLTALARLVAMERDACSNLQPEGRA